MTGPTIRIRRVRAGGQPVPRAMSEGAAGVDVAADLDDVLILEPGARALVPTGFAVEIPPGWEIQVRPRSGLAYKHGVTVLNAPGTIDADYRGEVKILVVNLGDTPYRIEPGSRIAQWIVSPVQLPVWDEVDTLAESGRGSGGFGSTG